MYRYRFVSCLTLAILAGLGTALAGGNKGVSSASLERILGQDAGFLKDALAKGALDKKTGRKVKTAALLLAATAQELGQGSHRDLALELLKAVDADQLAKAKELAPKLAAKVSAAGKLNPVPFPKHLDFDGVMRAFSSERVGGFSLEKELEDLVELKGAVSNDQADKVAGLAAKTFIIARLAEAYVPEQDEGANKTKKNWLKFAGQMQTEAVGLATAAQAKNDTAISAAANKLSATCVGCHDIFR